MATADELELELRAVRAELATLRADTQAAADKAPRRLTLSEVLAVHLETMRARAGGDHSSVELTRNAKGDTQIRVSVRAGGDGGIDTADDAAAEARRVYDALSMLYPLGPPEGANGKDKP